MKKVILILFVVLLVIGCSNRTHDEKLVYMNKCKGEHPSDEIEDFCECCYMELLKHGESTPEFFNAISLNCSSLLY